MKKLLLLFIPLMFFFGCEEEENNNDNSNTGYSCSNALGCYQSENNQYSTLEECEQNCYTVEYYDSDILCGQFEWHSVVFSDGSYSLCCTGEVFTEEHPCGPLCSTISLNCDLSYDMWSHNMMIGEINEGVGSWTHAKSEIFMSPQIESVDHVIIIDTNTLYVYPVFSQQLNIEYMKYVKIK